MNVERLSDLQSHLYHAFLQEHADSALLYYTLKYQQLLRRLLGCREHYLVATNSGAVHGVLPLMSMESDRGCVLNALPYFGSYGGILADSTEAYRVLVESYNALATDRSVLSSTIIENPFANHRLAGVSHTHRDYRIAQFTPLSRPPDPERDILSRCESSTRRNVKKARSCGVQIDLGAAYLTQLYELHQENMLAIGGLAKTRQFFDLTREIFTEREDFDVYAALLDGRVVAALLVFYFNGTVEYFTPAVAADYRSVQPLSLLVLAALIHASQKGCHRWNWGGTWPSQTGVYRFKRKWGAVEKKYHYFTQLNDPSLLTWSAEQICARFPNFFVVPFAALERGAA